MSKPHFFRIAACLAAGVGLFATLTTVGAADKPARDLNAKQQQILEHQVQPAYARGDPLAVLTTLAPLISPLDERAIAAVDRWLAARQIPPARELLTQTRLTLIRHGYASQLPRPTHAEAHLVLSAVDQRLQEVVERKQAHASFRAPQTTPASFAEYRHVLRDLFTLDRQLEDVARLAAYADQVIREAPPQKLARPSDPPEAGLPVDCARMLRQIADHRRELRERFGDIQLACLDQAVAVLGHSQDKTERFRAACALEQMAEGIESVDCPEAVPEAGRRQRLEAGLASGRLAAGEALLGKTRLLVDGLNWWLRGRYGRGPLAGGLLKPEQSKTDPRELLTLDMPAELPVPTDPATAYVPPTDQPGSSTPPVPQYDRRHHYTWAWENSAISASLLGRGWAGRLGSYQTSFTARETGYS